MARTKPTSRKERRKPGQVDPNQPAHPPHDAAFQLIFSQAKRAASELQSLLPEEVCRRIRWETMRLKSSAHTDARLTKRYSDVLYEVEIDDQKALVYVLLEHKSEPDPWTLLQLLEYMTRIWRTYLREQMGQGGQAARHLPIILPIVVHHGSSGWTVARRFIDYFKTVPEALRAYVVDFGILLDDVCKINPDHLLARPLTAEAKLTLLCFMLGRTPELFFEELEHWSEVLIEALQAEENPLVVSVIIMYMFVVAKVPKEETTMALQKALKLGKLTPYEMIMNADKILRAEAIRDGRREGLREGKIEGKIEGIREGIREGKIEGELVGKRTTLLRQLEQRFGSVPPNISARVHAATSANLDEMVLRVLTAKTIAEVVGLRPRKMKSG